MQLFPEHKHTRRQHHRRHLVLLCIACCVAVGATAENECELIWSSYVGGGAFDYGSRVAADAWGNVYVTGATASADFPVGAPGDVDYNGGITDAYVMKFAYDGSLVWSTYLGGSAEDHGYGIAVDSSGTAYITGHTTSTDFPVTDGCAYASNSGGFDVFVARFGATGTPIWTTYLGGSDEDRAYGIVVNESGDAYLGGYTNSADFPAVDSYDDTHNGQNDAFVAKFSAEGDVVWSTYLGGSLTDRCFGIATGASGRVCLTGGTNSEDFPTLDGAYDTGFNGGSDVFVANFSGEGELLWSTYLGGELDDEGGGIAVESTGEIYVTGKTSSVGFPVTAGVHDDIYGGSWDAFLTKFDGGGAMMWSSFLGGTSVDGGQAVAVDGAGNICVTGYTESLDFPAAGGFDTSHNGGGRDVFVSKLNGGGSLRWSTYLGGSGSEEPFGVATIGAHHLYVAGMTDSADFPVWDGFVTDYSGEVDGFVAKIGNPDAGTVAVLTPVGLVGLSIVLAVSAGRVRKHPRMARRLS
jgi:hypothetical protein